ncbi:Metallo-dependent hydrolase [Karstenula rhodostoma CBS 690.94]|uniref:Metallo-dependent hydrolase n=1 Tax=Karstenula rhodostoma CBS 690.94 TaxID=1392251 RepID=A0A9P4UJ65_9PLEO|nr:Metallo-dependent hydrolase [Karstenula rhodostoma CBS 690.94]
MSNPAHDDFPWHLGVFDAHCHPTDIMTSIPTLPTMQARCLTIMGTRAQDQHLVAHVADTYGVKSANPAAWDRKECMIPCFGWHPWFAHTMYLDDTPTPSADDASPKPLTPAAKISHYQSILTPHREHPSDDDKQIFLSLPDPSPFSAFLAQTRDYLTTYPLALVGEIGLDRAFRIPEAYAGERAENELTPGGREGRRLTPFRCAPAHQKEVFKRQLQLAAEMGRGVSVHGVQAHGMVFEAIRELWGGHERVVVSKRARKKRGDGAHTSLSEDVGDDGLKPKPYPPRVCLHSFSGAPDAFKQYLAPSIPISFFASFSTAVNLANDLDGETPEAFVKMVRAVPDEMVLVESDLHTAGAEMDRRLEDMVRRVCEIKGWGLEEGVGRLGANWRRFVFGEGEVGHSDEGS